MKKLFALLMMLCSFTGFSQTAATKKILIVVTSNDVLKDGFPAGYFAPEVIDYYRVLAPLNYQIDFASPKGGKAPMYEREAFVKQYSSFFKESGVLKKLDNTMPLSAINPADYVAVHCVGGFAALFDFPTDPSLKKIIKTVHEQNGIISAVCHGPAALLNIRLDDGKYLTDGLKLTSRTIAEETRNNMVPKDMILTMFPMLLEDELKKQGADFVQGKSGASHIETANNIVTGQNPESTKKLGEKVLELLQHKS